MKLLNAKAKIGTSAVVLSLALLCFVPAALAAGFGQGSGTVSEQEADGPLGGFVEEIEGSFDGLDLRTRSIWIGDMAYLLDKEVKVKGTSTKLGLLSDLKQGEQIKARLRRNEESPTVPYVILIERQ